MLLTLCAVSSLSPGFFFIATSAFLSAYLNALPSLKIPLGSCSNQSVLFGPFSQMAKKRAKRSGTPFMINPAAATEEQSCSCTSEHPTLKEIKETWVGYSPGIEEFFEGPAMFRGKKCTLKSFEQSGQEAIRMQCESLEGIDVVPECLLFSLGPHHFFIISPHIELKDIGAPDISFESRNFFYHSLATAIFEMSLRQISLQNIASIRQYDPSNFMAVISDISENAVYNADRFSADWAEFYYLLPTAIKQTISSAQYLKDVESKLYHFVLEGYTCHSKLGVGTYGTVYKCTDLKGKEFAIKTFSKNGDHTYANELRFLEILSGVPYVIREKHHASSLTGKIKSFIVLDLAEHDMHDLNLWRAKKDDAENTMKKYFSQIALAIYGIHSKGLIHEDLKPTNILVMKGGNIAVTDFGISGAVQVSLSRWGCDQAFQKYLHPRLFGITYFGSYVDWWSFGVMLFDLFCVSVRPTNANFYDYENLVFCIPRHFATLPAGISDLFKLIFSGSTYSSQPVLGSPLEVIEEAVKTIGDQIGCQIVNIKYFALESEPIWNDWKNACEEVTKG